MESTPICKGRVFPTHSLPSTGTAASKFPQRNAVTKHSDKHDGNELPTVEQAGARVRLDPDPPRESALPPTPSTIHPTTHA